MAVGDREWRIARGVPTGPWFDEEEALEPLTRTPVEVFDRMVARMLLPVLAEPESGFGLDEGKEWLAEAGVPFPFTPRETAWISPGATERDLTQASWGMESAWALAWALGMVEALGEFRLGSYSDWFFENVFDADATGLRTRAALRPAEEVWAALDLTVSVHWTLRQGGQEPPDVHAGVVIERHHALAWLVDDEEWDFVTLDT